MIPTTFEGGVSIPDTKKRNTAKATLKTIEIDLPRVATIATQTTGVFLPTNGFVVGSYINTSVAEVTISPEIDIGSATEAALIASAVSVNSIGSNISTNAFTSAPCNGEEITYDLNSATFSTFEGTAVIFVVSQDS